MTQYIFICMHINILNNSNMVHHIQKQHILQPATLLTCTCKPINSWMPIFLKDKLLILFIWWNVRDTIHFNSINLSSRSNQPHSPCAVGPCNYKLNATVSTQQQHKQVWIPGRWWQQEWQCMQYAHADD